MIKLLVCYVQCKNKNFCCSNWIYIFYWGVIKSWNFYTHWYNEVLYKEFLTPFRNSMLNRHLVSDCDRRVLPTRPRNHRGYALLAHMLGKMRSCATSERSNTVIRTVVLKKYNYIGKIISGHKYIPHSQCGTSAQRNQNAPYSSPVIEEKSSGIRHYLA